MPQFLVYYSTASLGEKVIEFQSPKPVSRRGQISYIVSASKSPTNVYDIAGFLEVLDDTGWNQITGFEHHRYLGSANTIIQIDGGACLDGVFEKPMRFRFKSGQCVVQASVVVEY